MWQEETFPDMRLDPAKTDSAKWKRKGFVVLNISLRRNNSNGFL